MKKYKCKTCGYSLLLNNEDLENIFLLCPECLNKIYQNVKEESK